MNTERERELEAEIWKLQMSVDCKTRRLAAAIDMQRLMREYYEEKLDAKTEELNVALQRLKELGGQIR